MRPLLLAATLALALAAPMHAGAKKQSAVSVRFHAEGGPEGGDFAQPVALLQSGRRTTMQTMPLLTEKEIKAFYPFPAQDGSGTFGAYFRLDAHGRNLFTQHTMSRRSTYLLAFFNGRRVVDLFIDRAVTDGIATIPTGLTAHDISLLETTFPVIGRESEGVAKKKKPTPTPKPAKKSATPSPTPAPRMQPALQRQPDGTFGPARSANRPAEPAPRALSPVGQ